MKIHMHLLVPLMPPVPVPAPKPPPTAFQLAMKSEELNETAQQQRSRLRKLYGARKNGRDLDEDTDSEKDERDHRSNRDLDIIA